jgi:ribosomal protein L17
MLKTRIQKLRTEVKIDTQKLRDETIKNLQELFTLAKSQATNENAKLKQRQNWTRIAAYICQVINTIATRFDERQIDQDLAKLEELINEATTKGKTEETGKTTS